MRKSNVLKMQRVFIPKVGTFDKSLFLRTEFTLSV